MTNKQKANWVIQYKSKQNKHKSYLTSSSTFTQRVDSDKNKKFKTLKEAREFLNKAYYNNDGKTSLHLYLPERFTIVNLYNPQDEHDGGLVKVPAKEQIATTLKNPLNKSNKFKNAWEKFLNGKVPVKDKELKPITYDTDSLDRLIKRLNSNAEHTMIMDLEFFNDKQNKLKHVRQIAGVMLDNPNINFNHFVFDPKHMTESTQLQYLQNHNVTYSVAKINSLNEIMREVLQFISEHEVDTIVSWDNGTDFKVLKQEGYLFVFNRLVAIDLAKQLADVNGREGEIRTNLEFFSNIFNIPNDKTMWHNALDNSKAIYKICKGYSNLLTGDAMNNLFNSVKPLEKNNYTSCLSESQIVDMSSDSANDSRKIKGPDTDTKFKFTDTTLKESQIVDMMSGLADDSSKVVLFDPNAHPETVSIDSFIDKYSSIYMKSNTACKIYDDLAKDLHNAIAVINDTDYKNFKPLFDDYVNKYNVLDTRSTIHPPYNTLTDDNVPSELLSKIDQCLNISMYSPEIRKSVRITFALFYYMLCLQKDVDDFRKHTIEVLSSINSSNLNMISLLLNKLLMPPHPESNLIYKAFVNIDFIISQKFSHLIDYQS